MAVKVGQRNNRSDKQRIQDIRSKAKDIHSMTLEMQPDDTPEADPNAAPAKRKWTPEDLQALADGEMDGGFAGPGKTIPIGSADDLAAAWAMAGDAEDPDKAYLAITKIASEFDWTESLPDEALAWLDDQTREDGDKSAKAAGSKVEGGVSYFQVNDFVRAVKSDDGLWQLDVRGVPYGGPNNGRDSDKEYFSKATNLYLEHYPTQPAVYYHGYDEHGTPHGEPQIIGKTVSYEKKDDGVWFRVLLNKTNAYAKRVWEAASKGVARASSGSIAHMVRKTADGHITHWPMVELSIFDAIGKRQPANQYAVVLPVLKSLYAQAGISLPDDILSDLKEDPKAQAQGGQGIAPVASAATPQAKTTQSTSHSSQGVLDMDPKELAALIASEVDGALKKQADAVAAEVKAAKERADEIAAAVKTATEAAIAAANVAHESTIAELKRAATEGRRLGDGNYANAPAQSQFQNTYKYDGMGIDDMAFAACFLHAAKRAGRSTHGVTENLLRTLAIRIEETDEKDLQYATAKSAMREAGIRSADGGAMKANELNTSALSNFGVDWVGTAYSTQLWDKIRLATVIAQRFPTIQLPQGMTSMVIPVQSTSPTFYTVAQAASQSANPGRVNPTFTTSKEGTAKVTLTTNKLGAAVNFSGELEEDSLIPWAQMLRADLVREAAEVLEHVLIDGDTAAGATTNINTIGGTPAGSEAYMLFDGLRKLALVTNTSNSRSNGALAINSYLETIKMLGLGGRNAVDRKTVSILTDMWTNWATAQLPEVKTRDVYVAPTVEGGEVKNLYGYEVIPTSQMHRANQDATYGLKANTAGKVDLTTPASNTTGSILAVRWDQWRMGYKRDMTFEVQRDAISDSTLLVMAMRVGLVYRDIEAAAISFNVTGV